jgi:hypothetical protein
VCLRAVRPNDAEAEAILRRALAAIREAGDRESAGRAARVLRCAPRRAIASSPELSEPTEEP